MASKCCIKSIIKSVKKGKGYIECDACTAVWEIKEANHGWKFG